jgi:DNA-binding winged helix-turn-helix (wHTH) protein
MRFEFADCAVDLDGLQLRRGGVRVHLEPQVFDVLVYLLIHRDRVVPKAELLQEVWGDQFVSESALTSRIMAARRAVHDDGRGQRIIRTSFGRGYQFVAEVRESASDSTPAVTPGPVTATGTGTGTGHPVLPSSGRHPHCLRHRRPRSVPGESRELDDPRGL